MVFPFLRRPSGVVALTIIQVVLGLNAAIGGVVAIIVGGIFAVLGGFLGSLLATVALAFGIIFIIAAAIHFVLAVALWNNYSWAWPATLAFSIIILVIGVLGLLTAPISGVILIIFSVISILLLATRDVRAFFGRLNRNIPRFGAPPFAPPLPPPIAPTPPPLPPPIAVPLPPLAIPPPPPPPSIPQVRYCTTCGSALRPGMNYCDHCGTPVSGARSQSFKGPAFGAQ